MNMLKMVLTGFIDVGLNYLKNNLKKFAKKANFLLHSQYKSL